MTVASTRKLGLLVMVLGCVVVAGCESRFYETRIIGSWQLAKAPDGLKARPSDVLDFYPDGKYNAIRYGPNGIPYNVEGTYEIKGFKLYLKMGDKKFSRRIAYTIQKLERNQFVFTDNRRKEFYYIRQVMQSASSESGSSSP